ncbi:hypothetical protein ABFS83_11G129300 [Erythranthe nasuta]
MQGWAIRSSDNRALIDRMMLRFRPIAPKPVGGDAISGAAELDGGNGVGRRTKRKYVRVRGRQSKESARRKGAEGKQNSPPENSAVEEADSPEKGVVTLQLLPERSESDGNNNSSDKKVLQTWNADLCDADGVNYELMTTDSGGGATELRSGGSVNETWVIVESVTDKFAGVGLGFSDKEKIYSLERDTCPGFISDWTNNVIWINDAYKKLVAAEEEEEEKGFGVRLVVKEEIPYYYPSFACRVRVIQKRGKGQNWNKIVPCDVWRMEFSGFAWKLDVHTALGLGL